MTKRNILIIIGAVLAAIILAIATAFLVVKLTEKKTASNPDVLSSSSSSVSDLVSDIPVSSEAETSQVVDNGIKLVFSSPQKKTISTTEKIITFAGTSDPEAELLMNGNAVERFEDGAFSLTQELKDGKNTFTFTHKEETQTFTVNYRYVVMSYYYPSEKQTLKSGSTFGVTVRARKGSNVTASFNGETITLTPYESQDEDAPDSEDFEDFGGSFKLPSGNTADLNLGAIKYSATFGGKTESFKSGSVTCKKQEFEIIYDPNAAPLGDRYANVGEGKIVEIIAYEAETFDAYSTNDYSRPTNNYLPKGTVDYGAGDYIYSNDGKEYALLRCGRQVYTKKKNKSGKILFDVVKEYKGTLPEFNEISIASFENGTTHTTLTLDTLWKAPFYFDILPQSYANPSKQQYEISSFTAQYIDITFCYANVLNGEIVIDENNPIFKEAKIIQNEVDYTLRLYLKKQGAFYGWDANYNDAGQLVFEFLNPRQVVAADNTYGADLTGVRVLIDVGHGGADGGAPGFDSKNNNEAIRNLVLAQKIKAELESIGATVYMTRDSNVTSTDDEKIRMLKNLKPDFCIAVHHDSNNSSSPNGFGAFYSQPFSAKAAELVFNNTVNTGIYKSDSRTRLEWHYYFMARCSYCPVVLTENGFISNWYDYSNIIDDAKNTQKAQAIVKGIAEYFLAISN